MKSISFGPRSEVPDQQDQESAQAAFNRQIFEFEIERKKALADGEPALLRLADIAKGETGQALILRSFLLSIYNGYQFKFNLNDFRSLDKALFLDCMAVLTMNTCAPIQEIHHYIHGGPALFEFWAKAERRAKS